MSKFFTPYNRVCNTCPEVNSGEKITDSSGDVSAKEMFYRIQAGQIIRPHKPDQLHYDIQDEDTEEKFNVKSFADDAPDLIDFYEELQDVSEEVQLKIEQERKRTEDEFIAKILKKYGNTSSAPESSAVPQQGKISPEVNILPSPTGDEVLI